MNERVRIYELARRMGVPNEDIITAMRELGYDIKSHSSTVDNQAVGLLITALGKKKEAKKTTKTTTKSATKAPAKAAVPPPQPVVVKPRVLSRYRPTPLTVEGISEPAVAQGQLNQTTSLTAAASAATQVPESIAALSVEQSKAAPIAPPPPAVQAPQTIQAMQAAQAAQIAQVLAASAAAANEKLQIEVEAESIIEKKEPEAPPVSKKAKSAKANANENNIDSKISEPTQEPTPEQPAALSDDEDNGSAFSALAAQAVRPLSPSVPIRIAAPSMRATPPRPPKAHRQAPSERHGQKKEEKARPATAAAAAAITVDVPKIVTLTQNLTVQELAEKMAVEETEIIKRLFMKGHMRTVNQLVELELAKELAVEMEYQVSTEDLKIENDMLARQASFVEEDETSLVTRPPVVTIMGHVDHGKTSLLDAIGQTKFLLTDSEAGGITQHIGAYHVEVPHEDGNLRQIVFLDTPGHEAFTAMRARGARATDIAILVVAADDGVMPQTIEAIDHAKAAGVPIIVAVNKVDKQNADPDRVLTQLMEHGLVSDKFGGETVTVNVSAKKRTGLDELLEMILLVADLQDLKANPDRPAQGVIIEAELSRGRGAVATALVETGSLKEGDYIVAGSAAGRVRALFDDRGQRVKAAGPSMPVEVLGLDEVPQAGDRFEVVADVHDGKLLVEQRKMLAGDRRPYHVTLESLHDLLETGEVKELNVIVKADVQGTAEAIAESVKKLTSNEVQVRVLRTASGDISENDVNLAASSNAIIIGFNVQPDQNASRVSEIAGVDIRTYSIIYQITDDLEKAIQGLIQPLRQEVHIGAAEVRQIFKFGKGLTIAGCMVTSGKVQRGSLVKIERAGQTIYEGKLETLKRFKDDAREVQAGFECGMSFEKFHTLVEGDIINCYVVQETKREITRN